MLPPGIRRLFQLDRGARDVAADVDREIAHHFAAAVDDLVRRGMDPNEARAVVERRFGDVKETRAALVALDTDGAERRRRIELKADWWLDVRHALRGYVATPGVTLAIVTMLALGVGANAAMYGILDKLLIEPPPDITSPETILRLYVHERDAFTGGQEITHGQFDYDQFSALAREVPAFAQLAGYWGPWPESIGRGQATQRVAGEIVTGNFFSLLGVQPARGRFIGLLDDSPGATPVAVISYGYWQRHFGGRDAALGSTLDIGSVTYTVVGVAPPGFSGPEVDAPDIWLPVQIVGPALGPHWRQRFFGGQPLRALARLQPGATPVAAGDQASAVLLAHNESDIRPRGMPVSEATILRVFTGPLVDPFGPLGGGTGLRLSLLVGGVALIVLIIACANVANLLLLRAVTRRRELAVRSALGAGRWRVARMLLIESTVLAIAAGAAAIVVAAIAGRVLRVTLLPGVQWATGVLDARVLLFAALVALGLGIITGAVPAIQARRGVGVDDLRAGVRAARRTSTPLRAGLLALQSALALVLVVGAGAFYSSFERARHHDAGFDIDRLLVAGLNPAALNPMEQPPLDVERVDAMDQRVRRLPGVVDVAQASGMAVGSWQMVVLRVRGRASLPRMQGPFIRAVTPNFFRVMGLAITKGRGFTEADGTGAFKVALVNTAMAKALWPSGDPLGACLYVDRSAECTTVVGVVATEQPDVRGSGPAQYYVPLAQYAQGGNSRSLVVRAGGDPERLVRPVLHIMAELFPDLSRDRVAVLADQFAWEWRPWKVGLGLFGAAGGLALFLAAMGLYAVVTFSVRQREHEFGIRRALGARVSDLVRLVVVHVAALGATGILLGGAAAYWSARFVQPLLYRGVSARDTTILFTSGAVLFAACLAAGFFPARAAGRADPRSALQAE